MNVDARLFHLPRCYTLPYTPNPKTWARIAQWNKCLQVLFWAGLDISWPPPLPRSVTFPVFCCRKTGTFSRWQSGRNVEVDFSIPPDKFLTGQLRYLQSLALWRYSVVPLPLTSDDSLGIWSAFELEEVSWFESILCSWYRWIHRHLNIAFCLQWGTNKKRRRKELTLSVTGTLEFQTPTDRGDVWSLAARAYFCRMACAVQSCLLARNARDVMKYFL
jgi:hypothetical protein